MTTTNDHTNQTYLIRGADIVGAGRHDMVLQDGVITQLGQVDAPSGALVVDADGSPAPRLAATRPSRDQLTQWYDQLRSALIVLCGKGIVHGDLSAYNILAAGERLVVLLGLVALAAAGSSGQGWRG